MIDLSNKFRVIYAKPGDLNLFEQPYVWVGFLGKKGEVISRTDCPNEKYLIDLIEMSLNNLISRGLIEVNITKKGMELIERNKEENEDDD